MDLKFCTGLCSIQMIMKILGEQVMTAIKLKSYRLSVTATLSINAQGVSEGDVALQNLKNCENFILIGAFAEQSFDKNQEQLRAVNTETKSGTF